MCRSQQPDGEQRGILLSPLLSPSTQWLPGSQGLNSGVRLCSQWLHQLSHLSVPTCLSVGYEPYSFGNLIAKTITSLFLVVVFLLFFWDRVLCSSIWSRTHRVARAGFELHICLLSHSRCPGPFCLFFHNVPRALGVKACVVDVHSGAGHSMVS